MHPPKVKKNGWGQNSKKNDLCSKSSIIFVKRAQQADILRNSTLKDADQLCNWQKNFNYTLMLNTAKFICKRSYRLKTICLKNEHESHHFSNLFAQYIRKKVLNFF